MSMLKLDSSSDIIAAEVTDIPVIVVNKMSQWRDRQDIQYNASLANLKRDFHGLADFNMQMATYSSTHPILRKAWAVISSIVMSNMSIALRMFYDPIMGPVGLPLKAIEAMSRVFAMSPNTLKAPGSIESTAGVMTASATSIGQAPPMVTGPIPQPGISNA